MTEQSVRRRPLLAVGVGAMVGLAPLLAGIGALGGVATRNNPDNSSTELSGSSLFNVRRINSTLATDVSVANLRLELGEFSATLGDNACLAVKSFNRTVDLVNSDTALIPASNIKIVTALVALEVFGPEHRFETKIVGNVADGVAAGNLFIVGGGDPVLSLPMYRSVEKYPTTFFTDVNVLLDALVETGVTRIEGSLVGDGTLFDEQRYPSGWSADVKKTFGGPIGALLLDDGSVFGLSQKPDDPAFAASQELSARLRRLGVAVIGSAVAGKADTDLPTVASIKSAPLADLVTDMLTNSDNNTAEMLLKSIGLSVKGVASTAAGAGVVVEQLSAWGYNTENLIIADGSGLDRSNRLTCVLMVDLLNSTSGRTLLQKLPLGGSSGTLIDAFTEPPALGVVRAKTGSLTGVKALSGFASEKAGAPIFALFYNGSGVNEESYFRPRWTDLVTRLLSFARPSDSALDVTPGQ